MKNRLVRALIASLVVGMLTVTPVFAAPDTGDLESQKAAAQSEVNSLQSELTSLLSKMNELETGMIAKNEEIKTATADLEEAQEKELEQYEAMKLRIKYMYEEGNNTGLEKILSSGSIKDLLTQAEYVQNVHTYDRKQLEEYVETKEKVAKLKTTLETEMKTMQDMKTEYEGQKETLNSTISSKQAEVANLDQQIQEAARKAAEEAERKRQEEEAARQQATGGGNAGGGSSSSGGGYVPGNYPEYGGQGNTATAQIIVQAAYSQLGVMYQWGGTTPGVGLDCSGLTQYCHAVAGISIPRVDTGQLAAGRPVSDPQPGDIAWTPGHVGLYIGNGQMIEAQQDGVPICISPVRASAYVRYW